jgi:hypothetical protein
MFRCDNCGSGFSVMAAARLDACPRCLAREQISVPLSFELGWRGPERGRPRAERSEPEADGLGDDDSRDAAVS